MLEPLSGIVKNGSICDIPGSAVCDCEIHPDSVSLPPHVFREHRMTSIGKWSIAVIFAFGLSTALAQDTPAGRIPKVSRPPKMEDFLNNNPREAELQVTDFRQFDPGDGDPVSQPTTAYLSYDQKNLYVAFICIDDPSKIRAHITRRDAGIFTDDWVDVSIDTFHDHRRNFGFTVNPYGIQMDYIHSENMDDNSFDTLWYSEGKLTSDGYVAFITIPFKSLRFPHTSSQEWGILLSRFILRNNESATWPYVTRRLLPSWTGQFGHLTGLENISPGRNLQFIPYGMYSGNRYLDPAAPGMTYRTENDVRAGVDAKVILRDAVTLDMAVNPDFSQVESDSPQVTVNQRYEVFFPEKRPFFIENADYFRTQENLFFSRRIVDPQFGVRTTGKLGRWGLGALVADDRAEGNMRPEEDPAYGERAGIAVFRLYREFGKESRIGFLGTSRDFASSSNRVFGADMRLKFGMNWSLNAQAVGSKTRAFDGTHFDGTDAVVRLGRAGRQFHTNVYYQDRSPDFYTQLGFIQRVNMRETGFDMGWLWRPEKSTVVSYGPHIMSSATWDYSGTLTDWRVNPSFMMEMTRMTNLYIGHTQSLERFDGIDFRKSFTFVDFNTEWLKWLALNVNASGGDRINYYPAPGLRPFLAKSFESSFGFRLQPSSRMRIDEMYLYSRLASDTGTASIFNNHIFRSKVHYQFSREFSLRAIIDYNAVLPNSSLISLQRTKQFGLDFLFTYLLHPGTAVYVGYTDIYENLHADPRVAPNLQRSGMPDTSTGRQFFVKLSYLLRM
jgi:hypothetical protein